MHLSFRGFDLEKATTGPEAIILQPDTLVTCTFWDNVTAACTGRIVAIRAPKHGALAKLALQSRG